MIENLNSANVNMLDRYGIRPCLLTFYNELCFYIVGKITTIDKSKSFAIIIVCILYTAVVSRLPTCVISAIDIIDIHLSRKT